MLENLTFLAIIIITFWLVALAIFFYASRQHGGIADDIEELKGLLEENEEGSG